MKMESTVDRDNRPPVWMAALAELPGMGFLRLLKAFSLVMTLPLYGVSIGRRYCRDKLYRSLAFPVF